jgi:hypothetical protein
MERLTVKAVLGPLSSARIFGKLRMLLPVWLRRRLLLANRNLGGGLWHQELKR